MVSCVKCFVVSGALFLVLAWCLYVPVWEGYSQFSRIGLSLAISKLVHIVPTVGASLGIDTELNISRKLFSFSSGEVKIASGLIIEDDLFDGVPVRIYYPVAADSTEKSATPPKGKKESTYAHRGLVYYHGGGWVLGTPRTFDRYVVAIAQSLKDTVIVSVDYRLAPEHPFPIPFEDCVKATEYFLDNAATQFNVDPQRIGVIGDSAGGNLAAAVALKLRTKSKTQSRIKLQVLNVPVLQSVDFMTPSFQKNANDPMLNRQRGVQMFTMYVTGREDPRIEAAMVNNNHTSSAVKTKFSKIHLNHDFIPKDLRGPNYKKPKLDYGDETIWNEIKHVVLNPYFSPLLADDLSDLPPALVVTCQHDMLRDDGILYVKRLKNAGVTTKHLHSMTGFHALFMFMDSLEEARRVFNETMEFIQKNL